MSDIIVVKLGTSSIVGDDGTIDETIFEKVVSEISILHKGNYRILIVSSGAVGNGRGFLKSYKGTLAERKAAAAIGNPLLINKYFLAFAKHNIVIAQTLLEREHFSKRNHFLQLRETIETLWDNNIIPIANENDVVNDLEIKFSDNDHLATLVSAGFGAKKLLIASSVEGVLDDKNEVIRTIFNPEKVLRNYIKDETSTFGLGGMHTKINYAFLAAKLGIDTTIFGLRLDEPIQNAIKNKIGTHFPAVEKFTSAREKWLRSGSISSASIEVDEGAKMAILKRKSLLQVGVRKLNKIFSQGEIIDIRYKQETFAVGIAKMDSESLSLNEKLNNIIVVHADDLVIIS